MATVAIMMDDLLPYIPASIYGRVALVLVALAASYSAALTVYRLFFSPLAGFPGPKIAAVTGYYESFYDIVLNGHYVFKINDMHKRYGQSTRRLNQNQIEGTKFKYIQVP